MKRIHEEIAYRQQAVVRSEYWSLKFVNFMESVGPVLVVTKPYRALRLVYGRALCLVRTNHSRAV